MTNKDYCCGGTGIGCGCNSEQEIDMIKVTRFTATWCGPCKALAPIMERVKQHYRDQNVIFEVVDVDNDKDRALNEGVRSVPTVKVGTETFVGVQDYNTYVSAINKNLT